MMRTEDKNDSSKANIFANMQREGEERADPARSGILSLDFDPSKIKMLVIHCDGDERERLVSMLYKCHYTCVNVIDCPKRGLQMLKDDPECIDMVIAEYSSSITDTEVIDDLVAADTHDQEGPSDNMKGKEKVVSDDVAGLKFLKRLRRDVRIRNVPVVLTSDRKNVSRNKLVQALHYGAVEFLEKPFRENEVSNLWTHVWRRRNGLVYRKAHGEDREKTQENLEGNEEVGFTDPSAMTLENKTKEFDREMMEDRKEKGETDLLDMRNQGNLKQVMEDEGMEKSWGQDKDNRNSKESDQKGNDVMNDNANNNNSNGSDSEKKTSLKSGSAFQSYENTNLPNKNGNHNNSNGSDDDGAVNKRGEAKRVSPSGSDDGATPNGNMAMHNQYNGVRVNSYMPIVTPIQQQSQQAPAQTALPHPGNMMNGFLPSAYNPLNYSFWANSLALPLQRNQQTLVPTPAAPNIAGHLAAYYATAGAQHMLQSIQAAANNANEVLVGGSMDQQLDSNPDKTAKRNLESDADVEKSLKKKKSNGSSNSDGSSGRLSDSGTERKISEKKRNGYSSANLKSNQTYQKSKIRKRGGNDCSNSGGPNSKRVANGPVNSDADLSHGKTNSGSQKYEDDSGAPLDPAIIRANALEKYRLKRSQRCFRKKIRYESRKQLANSRPRVRGQFVSYSVDGDHPSKKSTSTKNDN